MSQKIEEFGGSRESRQGSGILKRVSTEIQRLSFLLRLWKEWWDGEGNQIRGHHAPGAFLSYMTKANWDTIKNWLPNAKILDVQAKQIQWNDRNKTTCQELIPQRSGEITVQWTEKLEVIPSLPRWEVSRSTVVRNSWFVHFQKKKRTNSI